MTRRLTLFIIFIFALAMVSFKTSFALFADQATSQNNTFTAAAVFPSISPSLSPTLSEVPISPNPSISPTPTPASQRSDLFVSNAYTCSNGAGDTETVKGSVTITKGADLTIEATLNNALPDTDYQLWVNQDPGSCPLSEPTVAVFIHTDGSGNGTNTLSNHPLTGKATKFWVSLVGGSDVLRSSGVSL